MPVVRPLSPHISIYRKQLTSVLSILHRMTGVVLALGLLLLAYFVVALAAGPEAFAGFARISRSWLGALLWLGLAFSLAYHLANGVRHLFWDIGRGFELHQTTRSGWSVVTVSIIATLVVAWGLFGGAQ
ncbi:MAG: succinate dehydrogenase, cytochrome b556 subunit [Lysobacterales bacterium]